MALEAGSRLGHYNVTDLIGEGGMGAVYQARDTKLDRDVALKVLPEAFTSDPDRLARFEREAKVLASLNHPNIGSIYGLEEADGVKALVLELIEGPTLAARIKQGPIPIDEALPIAKQIAEALEAAHEQGVIHRDLKPANIKVREDGTVKVLDFGLAKALVGDAEAADLSQSPTMTATMGGTREGVILGTAAYMSPEQARGKPLDKRTDIWSFGCVLFEMLTGQAAFAGDTLSDTIAKVLEREPDWDALPKPLSSVLKLFLRRCLTKEPKQRMHDIADMRMALEGAFETSVPPTVGGATVAITPGFGRWRRVMPFAATTVVAGLVVGLGVWSLTRPVSPRVARFVLTAQPSEAVQVSGGSTDLVISPDGTKVVYSAGTSETALYVRAVDQLEGTFLRETIGGGAPFFSPDGNWVGFVSDGLLKRVPVLGGPSVTICPLSSPLRGASWGADDTIIFAEAAHGGLFRVPAGGGEPEALTTLDEEQGETAHRWPDILPGGRAVLFTSARGVRTEDRQIALLNLATGEQSEVVPLGSGPHYLPTGHIVYGVGVTLRAVSFDLEQLAVTGAPVLVLEDVMTKSTEFGTPGPQDGAVNFSLARNGSLVYVSNVRQVPLRTLVWVDRQGQEVPLAVEPRDYGMVRISPDGTQLAIDRRDENDIWIWNIANETMTQLTFDPTPDFFPAWTPDGHVVFSSRRDGTRAQLFVKAADGTGAAERLTDGPDDIFAMDVSPDGKHVMMRANRDLIVMAMDGERSLEGLLETPFNESSASISPDGRWLAYESLESGQTEVYVRPFPDIEGGKWIASTDGGAGPRWNPSGGELFYRDPDERLMTVRFSADVASLAPSLGRAEVLLEGPVLGGGGHGSGGYDVSPDGRRFLVIKEDASFADAAEGPDIIVVQNWHQELLERVPVP